MVQQPSCKGGKEYTKAVYCHPAYLTYMQNTSCETPGWMKHKLESRLPGEISITSDMEMTLPLWQKAKNWRASWWKWKRRVKKLTYSSTFRKLRSWHLVPSLHGKYMGKQWKQWQTILRGSKIIVDGGCSHEIKRHLLLGRKVTTNLDNILKSRDITLPTKVCLVKAMVFSCGHVWMWELDYKESWAPKNWCFWNLVLEKTLESPLDCKVIQPLHPKGNQF